MVIYQRCSRLRSELRSFRSLCFLPETMNLLCPIRALKIYLECSALFRQSDQLFVCFGKRTKGRPVTKQRLSRWIVDAITLAYSSLGLHCPIGVRALAECPSQKYVRRPAGPHRPHLLGFITWKSLPYRHRPFLLEWTRTLTGGK